jgi:hypothetical protein
MGGTTEHTGCAEMTNYFKITYAYKFTNGSVIRFDLRLDQGTLALVPEERRDQPEWTLLNWLLGAAKNDVNVNVLVNLDAFAKMVPLAADSMLVKITPYFSALLR